jgi:hypothetical protein
MTAVAFVCLVLGVAGLSACCVAWYERLHRSGSDETGHTGERIRSGLALSALLCATSSAALYVAFLLLWANSAHSFSGRQPLGAAAIWVGLASAIYALVGGLFAQGIQRLIIVASSGVAAFLWMLAGAASAAV